MLYRLSEDIERSRRRLSVFKGNLRNGEGLSAAFGSPDLGLVKNDRSRIVVIVSGGGRCVEKCGDVTQRCKRPIKKCFDEVSSINAHNGWIRFYQYLEMFNVPIATSTVIMM